MQTRMEQGGRSEKGLPFRLTQTLRTLLKCGRAVVEAGNERQLLQSICDIFVDDAGFRMAWIGYPEPDLEKTIRLVAHAGVPEEILRNFNLTWAETGSQDPACLAIRSGQICCIQDTHVLSLPLKSDGQAFGAITLSGADPAQFEQKIVELLEEWSNHFAHALIAARQAALRSDITAAFSQKNRVRGILNQCAEALVHHLDVAFARIWTLN